MAPDEVDQWLDNHTALFPSMLTWLAKFTSPQRTATVAAWGRLLRGVTLDAARDASERLAKSETLPRGYERHAPTIARMALAADETRAKLKTAAKFGAGPTVRCNQCGDLGRVSIYLVGNSLARWMEHARRFGSIAPPEHATGIVRCDCDTGRSVMDHLPEYVPAHHRISVRSPGVHLRNNPAILAERRAEVELAQSVVDRGVME